MLFQQLCLIRLERHKKHKTDKVLKILLFLILDKSVMQKEEDFFMDQNNQRVEITDFFKTLALNGWNSAEDADQGNEPTRDQDAGSDINAFPLKGVKKAIVYAQMSVREYPQLEASVTEPKDHLFDLIMALFDLFSEDRVGIQVAYKKIITSPCLLREINQDLFDLFSLILQKSHVNVPPVFGAIKVYALEIAVLCMLQTWFEDTTQDLSKTLVSVDEKLNLLENLSKFMPWNERS